MLLLCFPDTVRLRFVPYLHTKHYVYMIPSARHSIGGGAANYQALVSLNLLLLPVQLDGRHCMIIVHDLHGGTCVQ